MYTTVIFYETHTFYKIVFVHHEGLVFNVSSTPKVAVNDHVRLKNKPNRALLY